LQCKYCGEIYKVPLYRAEVSHYCSRNCADKARQDNLVGMTFGSWRVLSKSPDLGKDGRTQWLCSCECGYRRIFPRGQLRSGMKSKCLRCSKLSIENTYEPIDDKATCVVCGDGTAFIVDTADLPIVRQYQWWHDDKNYIKTKIYGRGVPIQRLLLGVKARCVYVDHVSGDTLDNRRNNLRICQPAENKRNQKRYKNNSTGYKGVGIASKTGAYIARITFDGKTHHINYTQDIIVAAQAYNIAAEILHGEFARLNEVPPPTAALKNYITNKVNRLFNTGGFIMPEIEVNCHYADN
jgi:hypothetical protein